MSEPGPKAWRLRVVGPSRAAAIRQARAALYRAGWVKTHVRLIEPTLDWAGRPLGYHVMIEATEQRGKDEPFMTAHVRQYFRRGVAVRTLAEGVDHAGGVRHTVPAGMIGVVSSHLGANLRVRFDEVPGHTFVYAVDDLERIEKGES
jgi:hypothetical protein